MPRNPDLMYTTEQLRARCIQPCSCCRLREYEALETLVLLQQLDLCDNDELCDESLNSVCDLHRLKELDLCGCVQVTSS